MPSEDAKVLREVGDRPEFGFEPLDHLELGQRHGWIEMEAAAKASGARFAYLLGDLVMVEMALVRFALETLRGEGFDAGLAAGDGARAGAVRDGLLPLRARDDLRGPARRALPDGHLRGRARLAARRGQASADELPLRYAGFSTCFRREAGAAGRDTRGNLPRAPVRQGRDVQLRRARRSGSEHERLLALQERILGELEIPYRVVDIPAGDLGRLGGPQVRLRGLDTQPGALSGGDFVLEYHRLSGAAPQLSVPSRSGCLTGGRYTRSTARLSPWAAR